MLTLSIRLHVFVVGSKRNIFGHNIFMYRWWLHIKKLEQSSWLNSTFPSGKQPTPSRAAFVYPMIMTITINFAKSINWYSYCKGQVESVNHLLGNYQAAVRQLFGKCQEVKLLIRQSSRSSLAVVRQSSNSHQAVIWQTVVRQSSVGGQAVIRQSSGSCQAVFSKRVIRQTSNSFQAVIRLL